MLGGGEPNQVFDMEDQDTVWSYVKFAAAFDPHNHTIYREVTRPPLPPVLCEHIEETVEVASLEVEFSPSAVVSLGAGELSYGITKCHGPKFTKTSRASSGCRDQHWSRLQYLLDLLPEAVSSVTPQSSPKPITSVEPESSPKDITSAVVDSVPKPLSSFVVDSTPATVTSVSGESSPKPVTSSEVYPHLPLQSRYLEELYQTAFPLYLSNPPPQTFPLYLLPTLHQTQLQTFPREHSPQLQPLFLLPILHLSLSQQSAQR